MAGCQLFARICAAQTGATCLERKNPITPANSTIGPGGLSQARRTKAIRNQPVTVPRQAGAPLSAMEGRTPGLAMQFVREPV